MTKEQIAKNREEWCKALRSGQFKQGAGYLARVVDNEVRYCCLGVACEISATFGVDIPVEKHHDYYRFGIGRLCKSLPSEVDEVLGLPYHDVDVLVRMNDNGQSFEEIAKYIEQLPLGE